MPPLKMTLWQAIDALAQQAPFSKAKIETLLSTQLSETNYTGNDVFQFFESSPLALSDGVRIANVDLRIKRQGPHPGFMVLSIDGRCITIEEVRKHYTDLEITDIPRGRSLDESTSHTTKLPWGELSFSFKERNPDCVSSIAFQPKKSD